MVTESDGSKHLILASPDTPGGRNRHTVILKQPTPVGIDGEAQPTQRLSEKSDRDSGTIEVESKLCLTGGTPTVCSPIAAGSKTLQPIAELARERFNAAEERASQRAKHLHTTQPTLTPIEKEVRDIKERADTTQKFLCQKSDFEPKLTE